MIVNDYLKNPQTFMFLCKSCNSLFFNEDNMDFEKATTTIVKYDMFGDVSSTFEKEDMIVIYTCPYCGTKHTKRIS